MGVYESRRTVEDLREIARVLVAAQADLTRHALNLAGECITCRQHGCHAREAAVRRFSRYSRLPARVPMASQLQLIRGRRITT